LTLDLILRRLPPDGGLEDTVLFILGGTLIVAGIVEETAG
jgi:hypothetical protein